MRTLLFFKRLKENPEAVRAFLACVFMIALLTATYSCEHTNRTTPNASDPAQVSDKGPAGDDQEVVCRTRQVTGSRFKERVCLTKAEWAALDERDKGKTDQFGRDVSRGSREGSAGSTDAMGGMTVGVPR